jgi:multiple sugar transport system substrate-binding protein
MNRRNLLRAAALAPFSAAIAAAAVGCFARGGGRRAERTADGRTLLHFWNGFTGPDGKAMEAMVRAFERDNPDVSVAMQIIPWGTYYDKLTLSLAYGGAPDVFVVHANRLPEFAEYKVLRPLADLYAADPKGALAESDFAPVTWKGTFYGGAQYALPLDVHPIGLYYNRDLFDKAGIAEPPRTWDDFLDAAKRMTRDADGDGRPETWGFVFTWQRTNFFTFAPQWGGGALTPDLKGCRMDDPATVAAAEAMRSLIFEHKVAPVPEGVDAWLAFRQGKVGMALEGIYMLSSLEEQEGLKFGGAPAPQFGPEEAVWGGSHLLAQPAVAQGGSNDRSLAAWRLMRYLSDHSIVWARGGQVPARNAVRESPEFKALPVQSAFAEQVPYVVFEPPSPRWNAILPFVDPAVEAFLLDLQTPKSALSDACRRITQVLERP